MPDSPKRPTAETFRADAARAEASSSDASQVRKPGLAAAGPTETARVADSAPMVTASFTSLPMRFGRYRVDKLLGKGAMGAVFLAHDEQLDRFVALKVAKVSSAGSARLLKRMETEAKAAANLDHPLICKVFDFGEIEGIRYIALQYIEGEDLKSYLKRVGRKRDPSEAIRLVLQMSRALAVAHEKGILHRDLKPENIMLNAKGEPVLMDFGLARRTSVSADANLTQGMILGTAAYMSPEQAIGKADGIDHRSDLYALGVMLFEMLTGEWPFTGSAIEVMGGKCIQEPPAPLSLNPKLTPQLAAVCHKLIARRKEDRFNSCDEIVAALESIDLNDGVDVETGHGSNDVNPDSQILKSQSDPKAATNRKPSSMNPTQLASRRKSPLKPAARMPSLATFSVSRRRLGTEQLRFAFFTCLVAVIVGLTAYFLLVRTKLTSAKTPGSAASTVDQPPGDRQIESIIQRLDSMKKVFVSETASHRKRVNSLFDERIDASKQRGDTEEVEELELQYREYQLKGKFPKWIDVAEIHTSIRLQQVLRDAYTRINNELDGLDETERQAEIRQELMNLDEHPVSLMSFIHQAQYRGGRVFARNRIELLSDGSVANSSGTWSLSNEMLIFHWPHSKGVWIDTAQISEDGQHYHGTQQGGGVIVTGERVD